MPHRRNRQSRRWYDRICLVSNADSSDSSEPETQASRPSDTGDHHLFPPPNPVTHDTTPYASHSNTEVDWRFLPPPPFLLPPVTEDTTHNASHSNTEGDWRFLPPPPLPLMRNDDSVQPVSESEIGILEVESEHYRNRYETPSSEAVIDVIRSMKITEAYTREKTQCPICKEEFRLGEIASKLITCNHFFCFECIRPWLNKNNTCPVCRRHLHSRESQSLPHPHSAWEYFFPPSPHILTESQVVDEYETPSSSFPSPSPSPSVLNSEAGYDTARDELDESHAYPQEVPAFRASTSTSSSSSLII